ncbi:MAG: hypothetical protein KJ626_04185 [Verrucomicrobia bacterium]|nr:hypothetical protein [Verrucomicrobiota bacterium]
MKKLIATIALATITQAAMAIPSWIGVYGAYQRHDGDNPGTFTVLMNEDYSELHAKVGIKVGEGAWEEHWMTHTGNVDGNSIWEYAPGAAFPGGATVEYYFHGWDDFGGNTWDSDWGNNYSFVAQDNGGSIVFDGGIEVSDRLSDICADNGSAYVVTGGSNELSLTVRSLDTGNWSTPVVIDSGEWFNSGQVAANGDDILVVHSAFSNSTAYTSADGGLSFSAPSVLPFGNIQDITAFGADGFALLYATRSQSYTPPHSAALYVVTSADNGASWSSPILLEENTSSNFFAYFEGEIGSNDDGLFVGYTYMEADSRGFGDADFKVAQSTDGASWGITELGTIEFPRMNTVRMAFLVAESDVFMASSFNGVYSQESWLGNPVVWRYDGGNWPETLVPGNGEAAEIELSKGPSGEIIFFLAGTWTLEPGYFVSNNGGASYGSKTLIPVPAVLANSTRIMESFGSQDAVNVLWLGFTDDYQQKVIWQTGTAGSSAPIEWVGNTYNWPANGEIDAGDNLWINTHTHPIGAAVSVKVVYSTDDVNWNSAEMVLGGQDGDSDWWHVNLGSFAPGTTVRYAVLAVDGVGDDHWDSNNGQDYYATVNAGTAVQWVGNVYHWPWDGEIDAGEDLWVNADVWPAGAAVASYVIYTDDGANWYSEPMFADGLNGNNEWWHANLGSFGSGTHVEYVVLVQDGVGQDHWASNSGANYHAWVN